MKKHFFVNAAGKIGGILGAMATKPFLAFWVMVLCAMALAAGISMSYPSLFINGGQNQDDVESSRGELKINVCRGVFRTWEKRAQSFQEASGLRYPDVFRELTKPTSAL